MSEKRAEQGSKDTYDSFQKFTAVASIPGWDIGNADSLIVVVEDNAGTPSIAAQVKVVLDVRDAVHEARDVVVSPYSL